MEDYGLDLHGSLILEEYRQMRPALHKMKEIALSIIREDIAAKKLMVTATEARVKEEQSLAGKLELKGAKYATARDITDLMGMRVITFYSDDVEKIAAMAENLFDIDRENSVDKRKMHQLDSFGYNSLHYICRIPEHLYHDPEFPEINEIRFELQIRTSLQHVWATLYHDSGYKSGIEVPKEYLRQMNRLAGMLELADEQFCVIVHSPEDTAVFRVDEMRPEIPRRPVCRLLIALEPVGAVGPGEGPKDPGVQDCALVGARHGATVVPDRAVEASGRIRDVTQPERQDAAGQIGLHLPGEVLGTRAGLGKSSSRRREQRQQAQQKGRVFSHTNGNCGLYKYNDSPRHSLPRARQLCAAFQSS